MNRNQRRLGRPTKLNDGEGKLRSLKSKNESELEAVFPPRSKQDAFFTKPMFNRSCFVRPEQHSFGQLTDVGGSPDQLQHYQQILCENEFSPLTRNAVSRRQGQRKVVPKGISRDENCPQFTRPVEASLESLHDEQWQNIDDVADIDTVIVRGRDEGTITPFQNHPERIHITEVPRVKIIAEKFTKYKKNNVELRKLEEKVVCVEYDVYDQSETEIAKPVQIMRAFFSIKPTNHEAENPFSELPSNIKTKFNISSGDLRNLNQKEVEIIDGKILENQPYLDGLRKILRRKQSPSKQPQNSLHLRNLYEMANRDLNFESEINFMSTEELRDIQNLILEKTRSSANGISRHTVKERRISNASNDTSVISQCIVNELLREEERTNSVK